MCHPLWGGKDGRLSQVSSLVGGRATQMEEGGITKIPLPSQPFPAPTAPLSHGCRGLPPWQYILFIGDTLVPGVGRPVWPCHFLRPELLGGAGCLSLLSILLVMAEVTP